MALKIGTWNLEGARPRGRERTTYVREQLAATDADVWVLTEAHPDFAPGEGYHRLATSRAGDYRRDGCWVAIWARNDITGRPYDMKAEGDRAAGVLIGRADIAPMWVFGTVLPWRSDTRYADLGGAAAFEAAIRGQAGEWGAARVSEPRFEMCVAGDFNQEFNSPPRAGSRRGTSALDEVLLEHKLRCVTGGSITPQTTVDGASIDHVLLSEGLRVDGSIYIWPQSAMMPVEAPDHYGVRVTLSMR